MLSSSQEGGGNGLPCDTVSIRHSEQCRNKSATPGSGVMVQHHSGKRLYNGHQRGKYNALAVYSIAAVIGVLFKTSLFLWGVFGRQSRKDGDLLRPKPFRAIGGNPGQCGRICGVFLKQSACHRGTVELGGYHQQPEQHRGGQKFGWSRRIRQHCLWIFSAVSIASVNSSEPANHSWNVCDLGAMYHQIQAWPTPVIFERSEQGPPFVSESVFPQFSLLSLTYNVPIQQSISDTFNDGYSLLTMVVDGPIQRNIADQTPSGNFSLLSMIFIAPITRSVTDATPAADFSLLSMVYNAPVNRSVADATPAADFSLLSMTAP